MKGGLHDSVGMSMASQVGDLQEELAYTNEHNNDKGKLDTHLHNI